MIDVSTAAEVVRGLPLGAEGGVQRQVLGRARLEKELERNSVCVYVCEREGERGELGRERERKKAWDRVKESA